MFCPPQRRSLKTRSLWQTKTFQKANFKYSPTRMKKFHTITNGKHAGKQLATIIFWIGATLAVICILSTIAMILLEAIYQLKY